MMLKPWQTIDETVVYDAKWFKVWRDTVLKGNGQPMPNYYVFEFTNWVTVLPVTKSGKVILVKQYRYALGTWSIELPGGVMEKDESNPQLAAIRELREETGSICEHMKQVAVIAPNPATQTNRMYCFLATGCEIIHNQELDENEEIEILQVSIKELKQLIMDNKIVQSLHISAILYGLMALDEISFK